MKNFAIIGLLVLSGLSAHADSGLIICKDKDSKKSIRVSIEEMSEISRQGTALFLNDEEVIFAGFEPKQTKNGLIALNLRIGRGADAPTYNFLNLGSNQCFAVSGAPAKGKAYVEVTFNGNTHRVSCECDQD